MPAPSLRPNLHDACARVQLASLRFTPLARLTTSLALPGCLFDSVHFTPRQLNPAIDCDRAAGDVFAAGVA